MGSIRTFFLNFDEKFHYSDLNVSLDFLFFYFLLLNNYEKYNNRNIMIMISIYIYLEMQVLSDPLKRSIYNEYGEDGLKGHMASSPQPGQNGQDTGRFRPRSAEDIFAEFFGSQNFDFGPMWHSSSVRFPSYSGNGGGNSGSNMNSFGGSHWNHLNYRSFDGGVRSGGVPNNNPARKAAPVEKKLLCHLEELYTGSTRKMKISRRGIDPSTGYVMIFIGF